MIYFPNMAPKETTLGELGTMLSFVVEHMATKEDLAEVRTELKSDIGQLDVRMGNMEVRMGHMEEHMGNVDVRMGRMEDKMEHIVEELRGIRGDLNDLRAKVENIEGYRKEIDHALERIARIEQHLGVSHAA